MAPLVILVCLAAGCATGADDARVYQALRDREVRTAASLMQATLEEVPDGRTRSWHDANTGHGGRITPVRSFIGTDGRFCRDYREELKAAGARGSFVHTACRDARGTWIWLERRPEPDATTGGAVPCRLQPGFVFGTTAGDRDQAPARVALSWSGADEPAPGGRHPAALRA